MAVTDGTFGILDSETCKKLCCEALAPEKNGSAAERRCHQGSAAKGRIVKTTFWMCIVSAILGSILAIGLTNWHAQSQAETGGFRDTFQESQTPVFERPAVGQQNAVTSLHKFTPEELVSIAVYEKVNRSVVNIRTVSRPTSRFSYGPSEGAGSGWVYDRDGHIVTNHHVIAGSDLVEVTFHDGQSSEATVVGADPANDIAVLQVKISAESLVPVEIGESSSLRVGQRVYAIGNPFGLERTMTEGIVSSLNRMLRAETGTARLIHSIIQIDAALNQGNSGGPLLDTQGLLIGMNTAIASSTGENTGIGFAISANNIKRIVPILIRDGRIVRPSLGIAFAFPTPDGVGIYQLIENGAAEKAGLLSAFWVDRVEVSGGVMTTQRVQPRRADQILSINDQPVRTAEVLLSEVEKYRPGEVVNVRILRQGKQIVVKIELAEE